VLSIEATNSNFIVFGLTRLRVYTALEASTLTITPLMQLGFIGRLYLVISYDNYRIDIHESRE